MMKEVKMTPKLKKFLIERKLLQKYKKNVDMILVQNEIVMGHILNAFIWEETPEGHKFWNAIYGDFCNYTDV